MNTLKLLAKQDPKEWPTVKTVLARIVNKGNEKEYQGTVLKNYTETVVASCTRKAVMDLEGLD